MKTRLKVYSSREADLFISEGVERDLDEEHNYEEDIQTKRRQDYMEHVLDCYFSREVYKLSGLWKRLKGLDRMAILSAHGHFDGRWLFDDGEREYPVQRWINQQDGKYSALLINCCNPGRQAISSKKSLVLVPNKVYSIFDHLRGDVQIELYLPGSGYIDEIVIEDEIRQLKRKVERQEKAEAVKAWFLSLF